MKTAVVSLVSVGLALFHAPPARAVDILDTAENIFYKPGDTTRVGIEVEFKGLDPRQAADLVAKQLGGHVEEKREVYKTTVKEVLADGTKIYNEATNLEYIVKGSSIGNVILKPDLNQVADVGEIDMTQVVTELVTEPIRMPEVQKLQKCTDMLKKAGATGTDAKTAVATQVNVEIGKGDPLKNTKPEEIVDLMRSYMRPEHREQIKSHLKVPEIRQKYAAPFSDGMMKKMLDPGYKPTWRELYDDFIYRQSLEMLGHADAWTMPIEKARPLLLAAADPIVPKVVKLNPLRISSLLMFVEKDDPMTKLYHTSGWAVPRPLVEFREWNNDFTVEGPTKQALGLIEGAKDYGYYDHDKLVYFLSGVDEATLVKLRERINAAPDRNRVKTIFRYMLGDPKSGATAADMGLIPELEPYYKKTEVGFFPADIHGKQPLVIPGESIVYHRRHIHRDNILGKYNPALVDHNIQQALENKYAEYKFFNEYAPGSMAETESLAKFGGGHLDSIGVRGVVQLMDQKFPKGWVLKGVWDLGSEKDIVTSKTDIVKAVETYEKSGFEEFKKGLEAKYAKLHENPELFLAELKKHPGYKGWKIKKILEKPELAIVQSMVDIDREFRVEIVGGRVLGNGSTMDRFRYMVKPGDPYVEPTKETIAKIEKFAQSVLDKLPPELRGMPMGMDVALLKDGGAVMIESNPGANSTFLYEEEEASIIALRRAMDQYAKDAKAGKVHPGLSAEKQMEFLRKKFGEWGIDTEKMYPRMQFAKDRIIDPDFAAQEVAHDYYKVGAGAAAKKPPAAAVAAPAGVADQAPVSDRLPGVSVRKPCASSIFGILSQALKK